MPDPNSPSPEYSSPTPDFVPQFSTVQYMPPPGSERCAKCSTLLTTQYFVAGGKKICPGCAMQVASGQSEADHAAFVRGLIFGIGGAFAGMILYAAVTVVLHITIGYFALAVGWMVATAMMKGSNHRGGRHYQIAAAILTYAAISLASIPEILYTVFQGHVAIADWGNFTGQLILYGIASPFLGFGRNPAWAAIGLIILFVGIRIAWRMTRAQRSLVAGPYQVAAS